MADKAVKLGIIGVGQIGKHHLDNYQKIPGVEMVALDVCLHNNLHMPATKAVLEAGKHVYCEKPMAGSYRDAETMFETAKETGLKLSIQLATLFSNETKAARLL